MSEIKDRNAVKKQKYLSWILLLTLLFLAFLIGRSYEENLTLNSPTLTPLVSNAQQVSQPTWTTYTNSAYNFSLQYPSTWHSDATSASAAYVLRRKNDTETSISFSHAPVKDPFIGRFPATANETMWVGNKQIVFTDYFTGLGAQSAAYTNFKKAPMGGSIYTITINLGATNIAENTITVKKILASFTALK